jgi:tetratricopeptide (TPR) repeat protein
VARVVSRSLALAVLVLASIPHVAGAAVTVRAAVERNQVFVGEPFVLTIDVEGTQQAGPPELGDLGAFDASYVGPTTRFSSVNGRVTSSVTHRYALTAKQQGSYRLGPFRVSADGAVYETVPVVVQVAPRSSARGVGPQGDEKIRLVLEPEKATAYVGERIPISVELFIGDVAVDDLHFPTVEADGYAVDKFTAQPSQRQEIIRNQRWTIFKFRTTVTPLRPGALPIGPTTLNLSMVERARRRGSLFDDFFAMTQARPVDLSADPVTVDVRPLPAEGRPADFSGAIGQFDFDVTAEPREVNAGDPITVHMEIRGVGNVESSTPPRVPVGKEFRAYDPTTAAGAAGPGHLTVEQVLIPRDATARELPAIRFSFFEPESGTYHTIARGPLPITVRNAPSTQTAVIGGEAPAPKKAPEKERLGRDIVYIKDSPGALNARERRFYLQPWFVVFQALPVLLVGVMAAGLRRRRALDADPRLARQQRAGKTAEKRLSALSKATRDKSFYDGLTAAVAAYLADKLDLAPGAVDRTSVAARLDRAGAADAVRANAARFFEIVERVRYAPGAAGDGDSREALELAQSLVRALERDRGVARRLAIVSALAAVGLLFSLAPVVAQSPSSATTDAPSTASGLPPSEPLPAGEAHALFYQANTAYRDGDYASAMRDYEHLASAGFESGALQFNLGNAYFKQGKLGSAILAYERAGRLLPRDADVAANLAYARESAKAPAPDVPLWQRILFAPAFSFATAELAVVWTALWWGGWLLVALRLLERNAARGAPGWVLWVVLAVTGTALAFRLWKFDFSAAAVVVAPGSNVARFEPSDAGKEYFRVPEGSLVEARRARSGWVQIARADGLRGWMPADSVKRIER